MADRRLFFALWPDDRQREALRDPIKAALGPVEGQAVYRGNWHVTLVFVGHVPDERVPALEAATAGIEPEPFRLRFDRLDYWPRPKIACLAATAVPPQLAALVGRLEAVVRECGVAVEERAYRPHLTIARKARPFPPGPLAQAVTLEWSGYRLVESTSGPRGVEYSPLKQRFRGNS